MGGGWKNFKQNRTAAFFCCLLESALKWSISMYNFVFLWCCNRERKKSRTSIDISQSPSLCEPPGWSWGGICKYRLSACPFIGSKSSTLLLAHTPSLVQRADYLEGRASAAGFLHSICVYGAETFQQTDWHYLPSFLCSLLRSSFFFRLLQHTFVLFSFPSPFPLPLQYHQFSPCSVLRAQNFVSEQPEDVQDKMLLMLELFGLHASSRAHWRKQDFPCAKEQHNTQRS